MAEEKCIGCDTELEQKAIAAYAIMNELDFAANKIAPRVLGKGRFHASPVCMACHVDPSHRKRLLKAHFMPPHLLKIGIEKAGTTTDLKAE